MSNREIVLTPTRGTQVAFQGHVVARAEGSEDDPNLLGRRHIVTVYEANDGWLHIQFDFVTNCPDEQCTLVVVTRLAVDDMETVLAVYDPTEHLCQRHLNQIQPAVANSFKKALWTAYDQLTLDIERQMREFQPCTPVVTDQPSAARKAAFGWANWNPFTH